MNDLIEKLSDLRSQFNCFNENEREVYHTLSEAIKVISEQPEPCDDPRADVYYLAEKIGIHRLYALVVELRGESESCEDAVSRTDMLETYADLYDIFEDNDQIRKELNKVYDKLNALPSVTLKPDHSGDTTEMVEYDDCVSRQAVIDTARKVSSIFEGEYDTRTPYGVVLDVQDAVSKLPSVTPKRKTGKWIVHYECPKCGEITKDFTEYCPFCNADMRGSQNEPNKQTGTTRCHFQNRTNQRTMNYD